MTKQAIVPTGTYIIIDEKSKNRVEQIKVPGVQTCIAVILTKKVSHQIVAVAHIDLFQIASSALEKIIAKIKKNSKEEIEATLIGGDFGLSLSSSYPIYLEISKTLEKHKIKFSHKLYSQMLPDGILPTTYFCLWAANAVGPQSIFGMLLCLVLIQVVKMGIDNYWELNNYIRKSFNLHLKVEDGSMNITVNKHQEKIEMIEILNQTSPSNFKFFNERHNKAVPQSADLNPSGYEMIELNPNDFQEGKSLNN